MNQTKLRALLADAEKLADYLDDLHIQKVKAQQPARLKLAEVKAALACNEITMSLNISPLPPLLCLATPPSCISPFPLSNNVSGLLSPSLLEPLSIPPASFA